jgi:hypothetical protein
MKALKAIYANGQIKFEELPLDPGPTEVLVVLPENGDDPWSEILRDSSARPALAQRILELEHEIAQGKASSLDLAQL